MNVLTIKIGDSTHIAGRIKAGLSREALKIQAEALALAKEGMKIEENPNDVEAAGKIIESLLSLRDRKAWLICQVYGDEFTLDELEESLTDQEIDIEINKIIAGVAGVITKN